MSNDQKILIQHLKNKEFEKAWEIVKYVGYTDVPSMEDRYILFYKTVNKFNPLENNNFILYYKNQLIHNELDKFETFYLTETPNVIKELKMEAISPIVKKGKRKPKTDEFKKWLNKLGE